jgi:hypothetical protein
MVEASGIDGFEKITGYGRMDHDVLPVLPYVDKQVLDDIF